MDRKHIHRLLRSFPLKGWICKVLLFSVIPLFNSCSDTDQIDGVVDYNSPILFSAGGVSVSRAVVNPTDNDIDGQKMYVFGSVYNTGNTPSWTSSGLITNLNGALASLSSTTTPGLFNSTYTPQAHYMAANNYRYDFMAFFPGDHEGTTLIPATATDPPYIDVNLLKQPDVMVTAIKTGVTKSTDPVSLGRLEHQLSQVSFTIKKEANVIATVYLDEITATGKMKARYNPITNVWSNFVTETGTIEYFGYHTPNSFEVEFTPKDVRNIVMFPITDSSTEYYEFVFDVNEIKSVVRLPESNQSWEPGKRYVYNIIVTDSNIYIEVNPHEEIEQEDWEDVPGAFPIS